MTLGVISRHSCDPVRHGPKSRIRLYLERIPHIALTWCSADDRGHSRYWLSHGHLRVLHTIQHPCPICHWSGGGHIGGLSSPYQFLFQVSYHWLFIFLQWWQLMRMNPKDMSCGLQVTITGSRCALVLVNIFAFHLIDWIYRGMSAKEADSPHQNHLKTVLEKKNYKSRLVSEFYIFI